MPDGSQRSAVVALGMDPLDANLRQVFFFDTPDLALNQHGVIVRARRAQGGVEDFVVKLRRSSRTSSRPSCASCPASVWRSTRCREASSAPVG